jgi:hypothetical protein
MIEWLFSRGLDRLWLTTEPHTRAKRFYEAAGWECRGSTDSGELRYELGASPGGSQRAGATLSSASRGRPQGRGTAEP